MCRLRLSLSIRLTVLVLILTFHRLLHYLVGLDSVFLPICHILACGICSGDLLSQQRKEEVGQIISTQSTIYCFILRSQSGQGVTVKLIIFLSLKFRGFLHHNNLQGHLK